MTALAQGYQPPYPPRHIGRLSIWQLYLRGRRNMLSVFNQNAYATAMTRIKIGRRQIFFFNMPEAIQQVLQAQPRIFERKSPQMRHALEPLLGDGLIISDGPVWKARRPVVQAVTHASRMALLTPVMTTVAEEWRSRWAALPAGTELELHAEMARLAAQVITRAIFGRSLTGDQLDKVAVAFSDYQARIDHLDMASMFDLDDVLPRLHGLWRRRQIGAIHAVVDQLITRALAAAQHDESLVGSMAQAGTMDLRAFRNEAITLFLAGHETTANVLAWAWFLLAQAPDAEAKLHEELARVLGGRAPGIEDLPKLPFTRAITEETLRLYPPIPLLAREAAADTVVAGIPLPRGSLAIVAPWIVHRHRTHWAEPDSFRPERFLPGAPPPARYTYLPFSLGPRVCTGALFGIYETMICLATLAQSFRLKLKPGADIMPVMRLTLRPSPRLPMFLEPR
ncbi:MAG: cytochrome P450 [Roseomonas sp.]|nr:cytochrome P450 [Roseomonas sp.]